MLLNNTEKTHTLNRPEINPDDYSPEAVAAHIAEAHRMRAVVVPMQARKVARIARGAFLYAASLANSLTVARTSIWTRNRTSSAHR